MIAHGPIPIHIATHPVEWPTDLETALTRWRDAALLADTLTCAAKAAKASAYLTPELPEGLRATDATREAYATSQAHELTTRAAVAAVHAKAAAYWLRYRLERELQMALPDDEGNR